MTIAEYAGAVRHLGESFRAGLPLRTVLDDTVERYGRIAWDTPEAQKMLLKETILYTPKLCNNDSRFSFGRGRCRRFLRLVVDEIDHVQGGELDESFAKYAAELCQSNSSLDEDFAYVMFRLRTGIDKGFQDLVIRVSCVFNDLGHRVWEAGLLLCAQLVDVGSGLRKCFTGRRVLELGAGTGVSAAAYVNSGVEYGLLTDYEDNVVSNMEHNIRMNVGECDLIETGVLDATDPVEVLDMVNRKNIDTIVAADVTYDKDLVIGVVRSLEHVIADNRWGLLVVTHRNENTLQVLRQQVEESSLRFEAIPFSQEKMNRRFDHLVGSQWDVTNVKMYKVVNY